jgi:hypothetical protein
MTAYGKAVCFETNFLGTYAPLILRAAEKENISIPDIEDGNYENDILFQRTPN